MKKGSLHLRLAKALYRLAQKQQKVSEFQTELTELAELVTDKETLQVLNRLSAAEQSQVLTALNSVFSKQLSPAVINLLTLLVCSNQVELLPAVKAAYQKYHFEEAGISDFRICTSRELTAKEKDELIESIRQTKKAHLSFSVDSSLVGGVQIYENGLLTDCSVKNQLEHLRRALLGEQIV